MSLVDRTETRHVDECIVDAANVVMIKKLAYRRSTCSRIDWHVNDVCGCDVSNHGTMITEQRQYRDHVNISDLFFYSK